jgi:hypothetical protein
MHRNEVIAHHLRAHSESEKKEAEATRPPLAAAAAG